ncbi:hypothetical protein Gasu2_08090 [Galdieria sulphuraria]|nr:hypothetical protein Gasu2_08090 [Galdieria sulphuraria]
MSLKEKRCFQLTPLITDGEDLSSEFSGLTLPSTEEREKDCWEEEHNNLEYNQGTWSSSKRQTRKQSELDESNTFQKLSDKTLRPQSNTKWFTGLHGYPDSPRPPGTSLFNENVSLKKKDCKSSFPLWAHQRRKQLVPQSPKQNLENVGRNSKRKPSLRARLINRFITSTRRAVHEYAAAATAIISPSGDIGDSGRFQNVHRHTQDGMESTDMAGYGQSLSFRVSKEHKSYTPVSPFRKPRISTDIESRRRSKSFPESFVQHNESIQEENMTMSRIRSCSQVLDDDDFYDTKSDDWLRISGEHTTVKNSRRMPLDANREFSPVSPHIQDGLHIEENTREQNDPMETSKVDEEEKVTKEEEEKDEDAHQTAKYKKKMSLKLDVENFTAFSRDSRIVPVKTNKKKGPFV